jgi:2-keto-4-pentenoate hydratase/2-oxohepta-3-ene-1,7-dioic acid hydratase in catechol pathway
VSQLAGPASQFSYATSFRRLRARRPVARRAGRAAERDDLALGCAIDGETVRDGQTSALLDPVARLIDGLSAGHTLLPGNAIFTGRPSGVGMGRTPARCLRLGEMLRSWIEGVGELTQTFVAF